MNVVILSVVILSVVILSVVILSVAILCVVILSVVILSVYMLSVIGQCVIMLSFPAPNYSPKSFITLRTEACPADQCLEETRIWKV
jgi:hypothetical protein